MGQFRTMKRGDAYEVEEKDKNREWQVVSKCLTISEAKNVLKMLKLLEKELANERRAERRSRHTTNSR